ncbi:GatB/YqeY domain-containing protein [Candidatus Daviesbacteria bacterium]|nr:GatB/YqeY domain-containing protein [Candidatus Daviesbacteria bacterium]
MLAQLQEDLKKAQLARDELKVSVLRLLLSEIHNSQILLGQEKEISDGDIILIIQREIKKRKEAALGFRQGERQQQAQKEDLEAQILAKYLPSQLSDTELTEVVDEVIKELGANSLTDLGKVMGVVMSRVAGQVDGSRVSALVKEKLNSQ